jgi:putative addiction module killer protein
VARRKQARGESVPSPEPAPAAPPDWRVLVLVEEDGRAPYETWYRGLRDVAARARIAARIARILQGGNFGDHRERIEGAVSELRLDYGPGYRIYYVRQGDTITILLGGGVKDGQQRDIAEAVVLWERYRHDVEGRSRELGG